jgi:cytochrome c biogenesis factor
MTGLNPADETVQLDLAGIGVKPQPAKLSIDLTRKPLIKLVWYGLYIVLAGGALAIWQRLKAARKVDEIATT